MKRSRTDVMGTELGPKKKKEGAPNSIGKIKREIRNLQRLKKVEGLPPTVVLENERKLEVLEQKRITVQQSAVSDKYKMVRFFEKRKLFRKLKSARNTHGDDSTEAQTIRDQINYIVYYPLGEKYISLLPKEVYTDQTTIEKQNQLIKDIAGRVACKDLEDASQGEWSKDKNVSRSKIRSLQADDLSVKDRTVHSREPPVPTSVDDFFIIDRG